jgi:hypothetical protein
MPQPKTDKAGQTITPVMLTHIGDGDTPLTNTDLIAIINALVDDSIKGLLRSIGDPGATPTNSTGKTLLSRLSDIWSNITYGLGSQTPPVTFSTTPLAAGATYTGTTKDFYYNGSPNPLGFYNVMAYSDQAGTVYIEQSHDSSNWDYTESQSLTGGTAAKLKSAVYTRYIRPKYVNGATLQAVFRFGGRGAMA